MTGKRSAGANRSDGAGTKTTGRNMNGITIGKRDDVAYTPGKRGFGSVGNITDLPKEIYIE
jgi:hypothetical protein